MKHKALSFIAGGLAVVLVLVIVAIVKLERLEGAQHATTVSRERNSQIFCRGVNAAFTRIDKDLAVRLTRIPCAEIQANEVSR